MNITVTKTIRLIVLITVLSVVYQIRSYRNHQLPLKLDTVNFYHNVYERELDEMDIPNHGRNGNINNELKMDFLDDSELDYTTPSNTIERKMVLSDGTHTKILLWHSGVDNYNDSDIYKDTDKDNHNYKDYGDQEYSPFAPYGCEFISCIFTTDKNEFDAAAVVVFHALKARYSGIPAKAFEGQIYIFYFSEYSPSALEPLIAEEERMLFNLVYAYHADVLMDVHESVKHIIAMNVPDTENILPGGITPNACHFRCVDDDNDGQQVTLFESLCQPRSLPYNLPTYLRVQENAKFRMECSTPL